MSDLTETEQLQKNTIESLRQQRMNELLKHLEVLGADVDVDLKKERRAGLIYLATWVIWMSGTVADAVFKTHDLFWMIGWLFFIFGWSWHIAAQRQLARSLSAYLATIKVLEILGIIDPREPPGVKNKKKRIQALVDMVKGWATKKKAAQDAVYQPA